jgi:hypothetical protein
MDNSFLRCDGCGVEISWAPVVKRAANSTRLYHYCCQDCLDERECTCAERLELEEERDRTTGKIASA